MVQRELDLQTQIIMSVRRDGGYGKKISHKFSVGIPDLLIGLYPWVPGIHEVKDFGVVGAKFDRQVDTTPKQRDELDKFNKPYNDGLHPYTPNRRTGSVLIRYVQNRRHFLAIQSPYVHRLTSDHPRDLIVERVPETYFDLRPLFEAFGIAKVAV